MNAPDPRFVVQEFAKRTRINLEFIETNKKKFGADIFEVTQLLNSMLGLLIFPIERIINQLVNENRLNRLVGLNIRHKLIYDRRRSTYSEQTDLLRMIRNAFSHGNIHLGHSGEIGYLELWNYPPGRDRTRENENWRIEIHHSQLRKLVMALCEVLEEDLSTLNPGGEGVLALQEKPDLLGEDAA